MPRKRKMSSAASAMEPIPSASHFMIEVSEPLLRKVFWGGVIVNCALVVFDFTFNYAQLIEAPQIRRLFNIAREDSFANWISSLQSLFVFFAVAAIALVSHRSGYAKQTVRLWSLFAGFFLFLAADDGAKIHERVGPVARDLAARGIAAETPWYGLFIDWVGGYSWHAVVLPFFVLFGVGLFVFCWRQFRSNHLRTLLFVACALLAVAVGLDYFEGWFRHVAGDQFGGWERYTITHFQKSLEEFLEMTASCLLFYVFSTHLLALFTTVEIHATPMPAERPSRGRK